MYVYTIVSVHHTHRTRRRPSLIRPKETTERPVATIPTIIHPLLPFKGQPEPRPFLRAALLVCLQARIHLGLPLAPALQLPLPLSRAVRVIGVSGSSNASPRVNTTPTSHPPPKKTKHLTFRAHGSSPLARSCADVK